MCRSYTDIGSRVCGLRISDLRSFRVEGLTKSKVQGLGVGDQAVVLGFRIVWFDAQSCLLVF